jgi:hypothetical protein
LTEEAGAQEAATMASADMAVKITDKIMEA